MQVEVPVQRMLEILSGEVANLTIKNCQLTVTNEVLTERLRQYVERDGRSNTVASSQQQPEFPTAEPTT